MAASDRLTQASGILASPLTPRALAGAVTSGVLVVLAFPPYGVEWGIDHLVWIALVPLFAAAAGTGWRRGLLLGWISGTLIEGAGFLWVLFAIRTFGGVPRPDASVGFGLWVLYSSLPWAALGLGLGLCRRPGDILLAGLAWLLVEHRFPRLWPWHLGGALFEREGLIQFVDLVGASGLTALVLFANYVGLAAIRSITRPGTRPPLLAAISFGLVLAGALLYGGMRLDGLEERIAAAPRVRALIVQGYWVSDERTGSLDHYLHITSEWFAEHPKEAAGIDVVLWPEGADEFYFHLDAGHDPWWPRGADGLTHSAADRRALGALLEPGAGGARARPLALVAGGHGFRRGADGAVRRATLTFYLEPGAAPRCYVKNVLVPFGEFVPFGDLLPQFLRERVPLGDLLRGEENPLWSLPGDGDAAPTIEPPRFRNLLCYEATLPDYVRTSSRGADFLVNLTEDIWYGDTGHVPQHASVLRLRAVENRTALLRCTNVGPSGAIDVRGEFDPAGATFRAETFVAELAVPRVPTVYGAGGYRFPEVCAALAVAGVLLRVRGGRSAATRRT